MVQKILSIVIAVVFVVLCGCTFVASKSLLDTPSQDAEQQQGFSVQQLGQWSGDNPDLTSHQIWNMLPAGGWENPQDPNMYLLTEKGQSDQSSMRKKRVGLNKGGKAPSLSIVNPLDVLRERLLLEIARRRIQQSTSQIQHNEQLLRKIGKRSVHYQDADADESSGSLRSAYHS